MLRYSAIALGFPGQHRLAFAIYGSILNFKQSIVRPLRNPHALNRLQYETLRE